MTVDSYAQAAVVSKQGLKHSQTVQEIFEELYPNVNPIQKHAIHGR
jgi:predicted transcriptional regulator